MIGCNTIDPLLQVKTGDDYSMAITRRALENTKAQGFDAVEYSHALHWSEEEVAQVRDMTEEIGLVPWSLHAWVGGDVMTGEGASATQQSLRHAGKVALGLGLGRVVHHTNGSALSGDGRERLKREAEVIRAAWEPGFRYALENMSTLAHMEYVVALVDELGPEIAGICIDSGHANLGDLGAPRAFRMAGERLITTHLHDNHGTRDEHLPPGDADIAWEAVAEAIKGINYQGCLMLELTDQPSEERRAVGVVEEIARGACKAQWLAERAF